MENSLLLQITRRLLQEPSSVLGSFLLSNIVLRWALLADYKQVKAYVEDSIRLAQKIGSTMRNRIPSVEEAQTWPENKLRQSFISWSMEPVIDTGFEIGDEFEKKGIFFEKIALPQGKIPDEREISETLAKLPLTEAINLLSEIAVTWVRNLDPEIIKADAIDNHHYQANWQDKNLYFYVFFLFYRNIYEGLMQGTFTDEFVQKWR